MPGARQQRVVCAFEVEKSTSIYSGILRLADLAITAGQALPALYLVVSDERERETVARLGRSAVSGQAITIKYLVFSELRTYCDALPIRRGSYHLGQTG